MGLLTRSHRWLGITLALPLLLWTVTGLLFHLKPGWPGAYETLSSAAPDAAVDAEGLEPLATVASHLPGGASLRRATLRPSAIGPVYILSYAAGAKNDGSASMIVDARTGVALSPLSIDAAVTIARDAAGRSQFPERYGTIGLSEETPGDVRMHFAGGATVRVDRFSLAISQTGSDTTWINRLYKIHYLQWTGVESVDRILSAVAIVLTWGLSLLGLILFLRRRRAAH